ncbi:hypothetical protein ABZ916_38130 [Streptomyces sp. NPDC046853]|uniref:hypothetical protein n=1 Tax=Streptomyces sp. NPDC046853 TaxID=3154920 RepID=UPI0033FFA97C
MGVFARFRRKSKDAEEASTADAAAGTLTAEPEAAGETPESESGKEEGKTEAAAGDETEAEAGTKADAGTGAEADAETAGKTEDEAKSSEEAAAENVDIPKQQSAEKAADNDEADEGARK